MAFSEAASCLYALSCIDQVVIILKPRQEETLMHLHNGTCCMLAASTIHVELQNLGAPVLQLNGVFCWLFHRLCPWWLARSFTWLQKPSIWQQQYCWMACLILVMPQWAEPWRHMVAIMCVCVLFFISFFCTTAENLVLKIALQA